MKVGSILRKLIVISLVSLGSLHSVSLHAEITNIQEAINQAGTQRMLTQRMLKDYALIGMGVEFGSPETDLQEIMERFETTLSELNVFPINNKVTASLTEISSLWEPIRVVLSAKPRQDQSKKLQRDLDVLLQACNKTTLLIAEASGDDSGEIISMSGRQRMLSQRLAGLYMLRVWGVDDSDFTKKLALTMNEFGTAHKTLSAFPKNSPEITKLLNSVKKSFYWFELMAQSKSGKYVPSLISRSSDKILTLMDKVTMLYTKL